MLAAPKEPNDLPHWSTAKVHPDHHLQAQRALYSVPTRFIGKTVQVRSDGKLVRVYLGAELIKIHPRKNPGERSTDPSDYPPHKAPYALRDVDSLVRRAKEQGSAVGAFCEQLLFWSPTVGETEPGAGPAASVRALRCWAGRCAVLAGAGLRGARRAEAGADAQGCAADAG